jgi:hypothetical protein
MKDLIYVKDPKLSAIPITKLMKLVYEFIPIEQREEFLSEYKKLYMESLQDLQKSYEYGLNEKIHNE